MTATVARLDRLHVDTSRWLPTDPHPDRCGHVDPPTRDVACLCCGYPLAGLTDVTVITLGEVTAGQDGDDLDGEHAVCGCCVIWIDGDN